MSARQSIRGTSVSGHILCNATLLGRELIPNLEVSASVYNLFDTRLDDPVSQDFLQDSIRHAGRTFGVKFTYRF